MASTNAPRPWRSLGVLALLLVVMYGTMALLGEWSPRLGLDLRGGTSITLSATTPDGSDRHAGEHAPGLGHRPGPGQRQRGR